ncbi:mechanosensitive ion channel [Maribacter algarum]|uniref:Mechanosensitive ion channel n=1 Tax=Maribacter algarum (ex Zhang et al. 2020) TaxID=2578118 RepID=A0A5S3PDY2_9FLAO|nr:mechanosensitive ion channel domain-containing protein [Maribacter algarum]TMM52166.1 mechanosensitive ion channel [Maribacter algarum]
MDIDLNALKPTLILAITVIVIMATYYCFSWIERRKLWPGSVKYIISIIIAIGGVMLFVASLELTNEEQILQYLTLIVTAGITISSTSILGNLIAGIVNSSMKRFKKGDYVIIDKQYQGIVTELKPFHVTIQTDDSNFVTVPNLQIIRNPIKRVRKTNIHVDTIVSLGYDVYKDKVKETLKMAAFNVGLKDPFVRIVELGDYSISYKILGLWDDNMELGKMTSVLNESVIDELHRENIEIVSPAFMNQRRLDRGQSIIPTRELLTFSRHNDGKEPVVFDVGKISQEIQILTEEKEAIESKLKDKNRTIDDYLIALYRQSVKTKEDKLKNLESELKRIDNEL